MKPVSLLTTAVLIACLSLAGCGGGGGSDNNPDKDNDADGDGLTYHEETNGWEIRLDLTGDGNYEIRQVTSNPDSEDSDGDGFSDDEEKNSSYTDPMSADSDGDGLNDYEEVYVYGSNPTTVDSDGDATGDDPDDPKPPSHLMYDGSEVNTYYSSPTLTDTDGDGKSDYYEIVESGSRNPAVAELPEVAIEIDPNSLPTLYLTGSDTSVHQFSEAITVTDSLEHANSYATTASSSSQITHSAHVTAGMEIGYEDGFVGKVSGELGYAFNHATSNQVSWSDSRSTTAQETYQRMRTRSESKEITVDGGEITTGVKAKNIGDISFTLDELSISVRTRDSRGTGRFIEVMTLAQDGFQSETFGPNEESGPLQFTGVSDNTDLMMDLIRDPSALTFEVASFKLMDEFGKDFVFYEEAVEEKTAVITIDYGGSRDPERYFVATNFVRGTDGQYTGITLEVALRDILGIDFATAEMTDAQDTGYQGLIRIRDVERDPSRRKVWMVSTTSDSMDQDVTPDFEEIVLKAKDRVHLIFVRDEDGDKLSAREEFLFGTSDHETDSDGDGLSDYDEVVTGWRVPAISQDIFSDPTRAGDYDGDGLTDQEEKDIQTNPYTPDTDGDGISDGLDPIPNTPNGSVSGFTAQALSETAIGLEWTIPADSDTYSGVVILRHWDEFSDRPVDGRLYSTGDIVGAAVVAYAGDASDYADESLDENAEYEYRLFARHDFTTTEPSIVYTTGIPERCSTNYRIGDVQNLTVGEITDASITLNWAPPNPPLGQNEYAGAVIVRMEKGTSADLAAIALTDGVSYVEEQILASGENLDIKVVAIVDNNNDSYTDEGLKFHTEYSYRLFSFEEYSNEHKNYSSGKFLNATIGPLLTEWGETNIQLKLISFHLDSFEEGREYVIFPLIYTYDIWAELSRRVEFYIHEGIAEGEPDYSFPEVWHESYNVFLLNPMTPGDWDRIPENTTITQKVERNWTIKLNLALHQYSDLNPLWEQEGRCDIQYSLPDDNTGAVKISDLYDEDQEWDFSNRTLEYTCYGAVGRLIFSLTEVPLDPTVQ